MRAMIQAPKGGCTSQENQEWYEGGQFLPSTCMPKGMMKKVSKAAKIQRNISELYVSGSAVFAIYAGATRKEILFSGNDQDEARTFADALIAAKNAEYIEQGFMPHPTQITVH